jgi:hypothetical protein
MHVLSIFDFCFHNGFAGAARVPARLAATVCRWRVDGSFLPLVLSLSLLLLVALEDSGRSSPGRS